MVKNVRRVVLIDFRADITRGEHRTRPDTVKTAGAGRRGWWNRAEKGGKWRRRARRWHTYVYLLQLQRACGPTARISIDYRIPIDSGFRFSLPLSRFFGRSCMLVVRALTPLRRPKPPQTFRCYYHPSPFPHALASSYVHPTTPCRSFKLHASLYPTDPVERGPLCPSLFPFFSLVLAYTRKYIFTRRLEHSGPYSFRDFAPFHAAIRLSFFVARGRGKSANRMKHF